MGFFSWNCKECGASMRAANTGSAHWLSRVVVMFRNGTRLIGEYDGYGRVNGRDIDEYGNAFPTCYHQACWHKAGKPEYSEGGSDQAGDQGFFCGYADDPPEPVCEDD
jgi:hypothetical protein